MIDVERDNLSKVTSRADRLNRTNKISRMNIDLTTEDKKVSPAVSKDLVVSYGKSLKTFSRYVICVMVHYAKSSFMC